VERDWNEYSSAIRRWQARCNKPRQHRCHGNLAAVLEPEHELARGLVIERTSGDPVMHRRGLLAGCANGTLPSHVVGKRSLTGRTGGFTGNDQLAPAWCAKAGLLGNTLPTQRAARREDEIDQRGKRVCDDGSDRHLSTLHRLQAGGKGGTGTA
jgi:hypothetical protein